jgi:hypothetical protein
MINLKSANLLLQQLMTQTKVYIKKLLTYNQMINKFDPFFVIKIVIIK